MPPDASEDQPETKRRKSEVHEGSAMAMGAHAREYRAPLLPCSPCLHTAVPNISPCVYVSVCPDGFDLSLVTTRPSGTPVRRLSPPFFASAAPVALTRRGWPGQGTRAYRIHFDYDGHPMSPWCVPRRHSDTWQSSADDAVCGAPGTTSPSTPAAGPSTLCVRCVQAPWRVAACTGAVLSTCSVDLPLPLASPSPVALDLQIPKWTRAKFEISTSEAGNPLKQDEKKGVLREYKWGDMLFNYGALPQTWEDPGHLEEDTGCRGDNDPLDAVEFGFRPMPCGGVAPVKVLGVLAMIDDGETDWKAREGWWHAGVVRGRADPPFTFAAPCPALRRPPGRPRAQRGRPGPPAAGLRARPARVAARLQGPCASTPHVATRSHGTHPTALHPRCQRGSP